MISLIQRVIRAGYMQAEALFNRAFGDRLNPLYHLGAISFFLFWVVGATGIVLYAFFDTSVSGAYRSVQAITDGGFGLGSVLRTAHRHASDAMLLTMLLHLLRYFAFDRLRGFRWFSWVTGVVLLWLAYIAGANGYMLPWDRLAQYVTQTSFEWLDWLPGFGGTLIRNFILPEHVSDRLFSLLVFIHIGVPLGMLLLLWVHVQRVPKATTNPPRPMMWALLIMLVVLAVLAPVASQGPADLHTAPQVLSLDWFILPIFPLIHEWSPRSVWLLVGGATALLFILPWLPPRRAGRSLQLTMHPGPARVTARAGETLLEAGLRAGLALPFDCRAGGCGVCMCTVLNGRVDHGAFQEAALTTAMRARGQALMCCAVALDDVELDVEGVTSLAAADAAAPRRWVATVQTMQRLAPELMRVHIALPAGQHLPFVAGQYINIVLDDGAKRAFSFANAPADPNAPPNTAGDVIELHVRRIPGGRFTGHVFEQMKVGDRIDFEGPLGRFALNESQRPILFVAGATGFAPIKSILEDAFRRGVDRPMKLYWGVRTAADLYLLDEVARWQREHGNFAFIPVLSQADDDTAWTGRRGLVHEALLADHPDLRGHEVYACGSVQMVRSAVPDFVAHGLDENFCFSDAFVPTAHTAPAAPAAAPGEPAAAPGPSTPSAPPPATSAAD
ncbi:MAG: cytochrome b N-terminal domain-containing protein [Betaproteobacteria bacterium]|nr:cytochrome b N-terminal domain-containing protein [Betaproteobacteria bacterium]MCC6248276.1 cytochrome b N-terminal domain-containing protein [Rubrivivax sp.]